LKPLETGLGRSIHLARDDWVFHDCAVSGHGAGIATIIFYEATFASTIVSAIFFV
jgi:hypothetical protein